MAVLAVGRMAAAVAAAFHARMHALQAGMLFAVRRTTVFAHVLATLLGLLLTACGLVRAPVRLVSGIASGTAQAAKAPGKALKERKARKEWERRDSGGEGRLFVFN